MAQKPTIMTRLKAETAELHRDAEARPLQRNLVRGDLPRERYAAWLAQMYLVHHVLEARIGACADGHPALAAVMRDHYRRADLLEADLAHLGADARSAEPLPSTERLVGAIESVATKAPVALLGMLYVLEGSTNGSKFIATALRRVYGLESEGVSYMDPYGDHQRARWAEFKRDMDSVEFDEPECQAIIDAAKTMFGAVADISDELAQPLAV